MISLLGLGDLGLLVGVDDWDVGSTLDVGSIGSSEKISNKIGT